MKKVIILVEGQTEETFVRDVLDPYFHAFGKTLVATLLVTKRVKNGPNLKGGVTSWARASNDLRRLLGDRNAAAITTMLDYYGLPGDFPGMATRPATTNPYQRAAYVQTELARAVDDARF